jgi:UDP-N-acetylmuramyl pentapeptide synthase
MVLLIDIIDINGNMIDIIGIIAIIDIIDSIAIIEGIDMILTCGNDMKFLHDKIKNNPSNKHFEDINALQNYIDSELKADDLILLKGSHGSNIYKIAEKLSQE